MKLAVIGAGSWGRNIVRVLAELDVLHFVCDKSAERLQEIKKNIPFVNITDSVSHIFDHDEISAVVISTPSETHYTLAKEALLNHKDVFVEKPLALTYQEGAELVELAQKQNQILMVGHLLEYHPGILKLKENIDQGVLGKIQYMYSNRLNLGKIRKEENILWSFAPHDISIMLLLAQEMPSAVSAHGGCYLQKNIADVTVSTLEFSSGIKGHIFVSWLHPYKEHKLVVIGDKKMAVFDDLCKDKLLIYPHNIEWKNRIPIPKKENAEVIELIMNEPLKEEMSEFIRSVQSRKQPRTDGQNGLRVVQVLNACQTSLEKNGTRVLLQSPVKDSEKRVHIHETAIVEDKVHIGEGTRIWHHAHVMNGVKIGRECSLGKNVFIGRNVQMGSNVKIQNNVSIYEGVCLDDHVFCGPSVVFTNILNPRSEVVRRHAYQHTFVKRGASLGANATIVCGVTIGEYAFIGAGAVVTTDIPSHALVYGNPARIHGWVCKCGDQIVRQHEKPVFDCKKCQPINSVEMGIGDGKSL